MGESLKTFLFAVQFILILLIIQINLTFTMNSDLELLNPVSTVARLSTINMWLGGGLMIIFILKNMFNEKK